MSNVDLSNEGLVTLRGQDIPDVVDGYFDCEHNHLSRLQFGPKEVSGDYYCAANKLTSLEFCATKIGDSLHVRQNLITNLKDIHKQFKNGYIARILNVEGNPLESHLLGVILIPRLEIGISIDDPNLKQILNKHLKSERDVLDCQEELIHKGFKEFAQL